MSEPIEFSYEVDKTLMRRTVEASTRVMQTGLTRFGWQPVVFGAALGAVAMVLLNLAGETDFLHIAAFAAGVVVYMLYILAAARSQVGAVTRAAADDAAARGTIRARFEPAGVTFNDALADSHLSWNAVAGIHAIPGATLLQMGAMFSPIPDAALPGLSPEAFRDQLERWRGGAS